LGESEETIFVPNNINAQEGTNITFWGEIKLPL
jgi:hypothetical protein